MGTLKIYLLLIFLITTLFSCSVLEKGTFTSDGYYTPKKERYKLKNQKKSIFPLMLDTSNVYKLNKIFSGAYMTYPKNTTPYNNNSYNSLLDTERYLMFKSNRLVYTYVFPKTNKDSVSRRCLKGYYNSKDGKKIQIEHFVYGDGFGQYILFDASINKLGDTLIIGKKNYIQIYVKDTTQISIDWCIQ